MAHAQKPDFVFRRNGRVFKSAGASVQSTTGSRGVRISGSNAGYTTFRGSVKSTGYPLHSTVSPSLHLPCVTVCHHISTGLYHQCFESSFPAPGTSFALRPVHATSFRLTALPTCTCRKFLTSIMNPTFHTQGIIFLSDGNPLKKWHIIFPKI